MTTDIHCSMIMKYHTVIYNIWRFGNYDWVLKAYTLVKWVAVETASKAYRAYCVDYQDWTTQSDESIVLQSGNLITILTGLTGWRMLSQK